MPETPCNVLPSCSLVLECPRSGSSPTQHNHDRLTGENTINPPKPLTYDQAIAIINAAPPEIRKLVCADAITHFYCIEILDNITVMATLRYSYPEHLAHLYRVGMGTWVRVFNLAFIYTGERASINARLKDTSSAPAYQP